MTVQEFMECGLLQEINRLFLHPEGLYFGDLTSSEDLTKHENVVNMTYSKMLERYRKFGWNVQPINTKIPKE